jgi:putative transposase
VAKRRASMSKGRRSFSNEFKAKVAIEAIKGYKSLNELAREYQVHPNAIGNWKKEVLENLPEIFDKKRGPSRETNTELVEELYKQIGKQQVELEWLKKKHITIS